MRWVDVGEERLRVIRTVERLAVGIQPWSSVIAADERTLLEDRELDAVLIASAPKHPGYEGRRLGQLAAADVVDHHPQIQNVQRDILPHASNERRGIMLDVVRAQLHVGIHAPARCISVVAAGCGWGSW